MKDIPEEVRKFYSEMGKKGNANRTFEQRSLAAKKGAETKRKKRGQVQA